jgi:hypothetical protein
MCPSYIHTKIEQNSRGWHNPSPYACEPAHKPRLMGINNNALPGPNSMPIPLDVVARRVSAPKTITDTPPFAHHHIRPHAERYGDAQCTLLRLLVERAARTAAPVDEHCNHVLAIRPRRVEHSSPGILGGQPRVSTQDGRWPPILVVVPLAAHSALFHTRSEQDQVA